MLWHDILFGIFKKRSCKTKKKQPKKGRKIKLKISIRHIAKWDKIRTKKNKIELRINNGFQVFYCTIYLPIHSCIRTNVSDLYSKTAKLFRIIKTSCEVTSTEVNVNEVISTI